MQGPAPRMPCDAGDHKQPTAFPYNTLRPPMGIRCGADKNSAISRDAYSNVIQHIRMH